MTDAGRYHAMGRSAVKALTLRRDKQLIGARYHYARDIEGRWWMLVVTAEDQSFWQRVTERAENRRCVPAEVVEWT